VAAELNYRSGRNHKVSGRRAINGKSPCCRTRTLIDLNHTHTRRPTPVPCPLPVRRLQRDRVAAQSAAMSPPVVWQIRDIILITSCYSWHCFQRVCPWVCQQTTNSSGDNVMSCSVSRPFFCYEWFYYFSFTVFLW